MQVQVESAYAEAVAALLDATPDDALARFDAELSAAVGEGRVDAETARTLRWWQRESVRAVRDHAAAVLPPVISGLVASSVARSGGRAGGEAADLPEPDAGRADGGAADDEARRRTLVAGLMALPDAASA